MIHLTDEPVRICHVRLDKQNSKCRIRVVTSIGAAIGAVVGVITMSKSNISVQTGTA